MDDMKPELIIICNQAKLPVVGLENQSNHKTLTYNVVCLEDVLRQVQNLWKCPTTDPSNLRPMSQDRTHS